MRRQTDGDDYELVITLPDGQQQVERFADPHALTNRLQRPQHSLRADGREMPSGRVIPRRATA